MSDLHGVRVHITGIVQGVGFRPFVYGLATRLALTGWVRNTSAGVDIEVDGLPEALQRFVDGLANEAPPLARIDEFRVEPRLADGFTSFEILHSEAIADAFQPISPDVGICPDCLRELFDPADRRYRYPFTNCTNCGPRFTIITDIPYDRPKTTMAGFPLCPDCAAEYADPLDRRFHAQPVACPVCGPQVWLEIKDAAAPGGLARTVEAGEALEAAQQMLAAGRILAIKGLGGFHLACDATNEAAVSELRRRKLRVDKPFALMMPDLATVQEHCRVDAAEQELLESRERPIVLLRRRPESPGVAQVAAEVAPRQDTLGVMLPYTPLHYLLFAANDRPLATALVMTSGNLSEEPIAIDNDEARERLAGLADAFLLHNRPIHTRCDDSVVRIFSPAAQPATETAADRTAGILPLRRSRGYAPFPVRLPWDAPPLLACGAELKNTFCITRDNYAFLSHHIGDLENFETLASFESGVAHFERLFRIHPQALAYDLHPNYLATRYAQERAGHEGLPMIGVQHHHAHIAACMAEHSLSGAEPVIGVSFDGTGYGEDGAIWGGEFLLADYRGYRRAAHLAYVPLPGGDKAVREPWRMALAWLAGAEIEWRPDLPPVQHALHSGAQGEIQLQALRRQIQSGLNAPPTSSMGRLFDAAAALSGVRQTVNYEAQAAIEFEALASLVGHQEEGFYPFELAEQGTDPRLVISPGPAIQALLADQAAGLPLPVLSARFHNGVAHLVLDVCRSLRASEGVAAVALSGGVWQNVTLLRKAVALLAADGFTVYIHRRVPANDGGLALGQAAIAIQKLAG